MTAWLPFVVLVLLGPFFFAFATLLRVVFRRRGSDRRRVTQQVVAGIGMLLLAGLYIPLLPRVGVVWAFDIVMLTVIVWTLVVGLLIFGEPDPTRR
jgi:hypothetical protein